MEEGRDRSAICTCAQAPPPLPGLGVQRRLADCECHPTLSQRGPMGPHSEGPAEQEVLKQGVKTTLWKAQKQGCPSPGAGGSGCRYALCCGLSS